MAAQRDRLALRRKLRLELLDLADRESKTTGQSFSDQSAVAMARHRVEHCELAIRIFELEYPAPPPDPVQMPNWTPPWMMQHMAAATALAAEPVEPAPEPTV